jgi:hypothetical protein
MSALKLYVVHIRDNIVEDVGTYRELDSVQNDLVGHLCPDSVYVLHCGFFRPNIRYPISLPPILNGKVLYSAALKWALPSSFQYAKPSVASMLSTDQEIPCFLARDGWGYTLTCEECKDIVDLSIGTKSFVGQSSNKKTIVLAAEAVLDASSHPLNKEEIFANIMELGLYQFNTPTPVHVLDVSLNRHTLGTLYSKASSTPIFGKTRAGKYYLLNRENKEPTGWVSAVLEKYPELYEEIEEYQIRDDTSYISQRELLPDILRVSLDQRRFELLLPTIDRSNPGQHLEISPQWLLDSNISDLGLTVRADNALRIQGISVVSDIIKYSKDEILKFPNMGKKSITDICNSIADKVLNTSYEVVELGGITSNAGGVSSIVHPFSDELGEEKVKRKLEQKTLFEHLTLALDQLDEVDRIVLHGRFGFSGRTLTLEQLGDKIGVTRERVRQRQTKQIKRMLAKEYWDDLIEIRIGKLLLNRTEPLILEMLDIEDAWFKGFGDKFKCLSNVLQLFSKNKVQVIDVGGRNIVTRITQKRWEKLRNEPRVKLKGYAQEGKWRRIDIDQNIESWLSEFSAKELLGLFREMFAELLQYESEADTALLVGYGKSVESVIKGVLAQANQPLHYTEITRRVSEALEKEVDVRRVHNALMMDTIWMFDRGTYGLIDHCPIPESRRMSIRSAAEELMYQEAINKQWHSKILTQQIGKKYPLLSIDLDPYTLRMSIQGSPKILYLRRMVWARSDSGMDVGDRIETTESFIQILEEVGKPLSGKELKRRLSEIRSVAEGMQVHGNERMIAVAPNVWGLRDWDSESKGEGNE